MPTREAKPKGPIREAAGVIIPRVLVGGGCLAFVGYALFGARAPDPKLPVTVTAANVRPYAHSYSESTPRQPSGPAIAAGTEVVAHCVDIDEVKPPHTSIYITDGQMDSYVRAYQLSGNSDPTPTFNISLSGLQQRLPLC